MKIQTKNVLTWNPNEVNGDGGSAAGAEVEEEGAETAEKIKKSLQHAPTS
jgi:hypothetical protein